MKELLSQIKLPVKLVKGQVKKKKRKGIYIQMHMLVQLSFSLTSNADYLVPDLVAGGHLRCQLPYALLISLLASLTTHALSLCISPGVRQRTISKHLELPVTGLLGWLHYIFFLLILHRLITQNESLGVFLLPVQLIRSLVPPPLVWRCLPLSKPHLFPKAGPYSQQVNW